MAHASVNMQKQYLIVVVWSFLTEMVKEWNGSLVHKSEFEAKHPQQERQRHGQMHKVYKMHVPRA